MRKLLGGGVAVSVSVSVLIAGAALLLSVTGRQVAGQDDATRLAKADAPGPAIPGLIQFPDRPPVLMVKPQKDKPARSLSLSDVSVEVKIAGLTAHTSMSMTFKSDINRVLEGDLYFPLPQGATVSGYAIDINNQMVEAVPVEQKQARVIFETEQRKGIDPGLVEWVKGNNFKTRIWPIPAKGSRTVRVEYVTPLAGVAIDGKTAAAYQLPLRYREKIGNFNVSIKIVGGAKPNIVQGGNWIAPAKAEKGHAYIGRHTDARPDKDLVITLPATESTANVGIGPRGRDHYFVINDIPEAPQMRFEPAAKGRVAIYWDASMGRAGSDMKREFQLLRTLVQKFAHGTVDVIAFCEKTRPVVSFHMAGRPAEAVADKIIKHLRTIPYDGGTNLQALPLVENYKDLPGAVVKTAPANYNYAFLFTDGLNNLGDDMPSKIEMPVHTIATDSRANHPLLRHIAASSGGVYFNLASVEDKQVIADIERPPFAFIKADYDRRKITEVYPNTTEPVRGRFVIAGVLQAPEATIALHYGYGSKLLTVKYTLTQADAARMDQGGELVARLWAQKKVDALLTFPKKNKDELTRVGRKFGLVTPGTSLLVLERLDQYLTYGIEPPKSRKKIYEQWVKQIENRQAAKQKTKQQKIEQVVKQWNARVKWWETKFTYPEGFVYKADDKKKSTSPRPARNATRPADPAAPPAAQAAAEVESAETPARGGAAFGASLFGSGGNADKKSKGARKSGRASIALKQWDPKTPYITAMNKAGVENAYAVYLDMRNQYAGSPAFFLDCASYFFKHRKIDMAVRVLTNVLELQLKDARLMRIVAHKLQQQGQIDMAVDIFSKVLEARPEEPQSHRDLALALEARGQQLQARSKDAADPYAMLRRAFDDYYGGINLLNKVVTENWDGRFPGIEVMAVNEANRLASRANGLPLRISWNNPLDSRLQKLLDVDIRIVMTWDTDLTDIDLWITEPSTERCNYSHNRTKIGGMITKDFTRGYGPEIYLIRKAMPGKYKISAKFYGTSQQKLTGGTTVQATVITNYGRPNEQRQSLTLRLKTKKEVVVIGEITFGDAAKPQPKKAPKAK